MKKIIILFLLALVLTRVTSAQSVVAGFDPKKIPLAVHQNWDPNN